LSLAPESLETLKAEGFYRYWIERDYPAAIAIFERIREQSPSDDTATYALAAVARRQGRWPDSLKLWEQALSLDPRNAPTYLDAASTAESMRDLAAANRILDQGLSFFPENSGLLEDRVLILEQTGRLEEAQQILDRVHIAVGDDNLVNSFVTISILRRQYDAAVALLDSQLKHEELPVDSRGYYQLMLGDLRRHSGNAEAARAAYEDAKKNLESALHDQPDSPALFGNLAYVEAGLGNRDQAYAQAQRAIQILPESLDAYYGPYFEEVMARLQARFGDREPAITSIRHLLQISYGDPPLAAAVLKVDPDFDNLRGDPAFQQLLSGTTPAAAGN
jgi:tetratricopeptide (TPR) repeat protein